MKLSNTLAFSITSIVVMLAIGLVFKATYLIVHLHDDPNTPNTQENPDSHSEFELLTANYISIC